MKISFVLLLLLGTVVWSDQYKEVLTLENSPGRLAIRIEFRSDGDRRGILRIDNNGKGGTLILDDKQWRALQRNWGAAEKKAFKLKSGQTTPIGVVECRSGGLVSLKAVYDKSMPGVLITRKSAVGDSYPDVPVEIMASQFDRVTGALNEVSSVLKP